MILPDETEAERAFWAGDFDGMQTSNVILLSLRATYARQSGEGAWYGELTQEWRGLFLAAQSVRDQHYEETRDLLTLCAQSNHPYIRVMSPYYAAWAQWSTDLPIVNAIPRDTAFANAMYLSMEAWRAQRDGDFSQHLLMLHDAIKAFFMCDPIPAYWISRLLSPAMTVAFERGDHEMMRSLEQFFNAIDWVSQLEHQRFDCLRAMARLAFIVGDTQSALRYIGAAKEARLPDSCLAHAYLHTASFAVHAGEKMWAVDQIIRAQSLLQEPITPCPDYRTVVLGMALQTSYITPKSSESWLRKYLEMPPDANTAGSHDGRLDAIANISIAKVGNDEMGMEMLSRSYETLARYGYHYRAAQAAAIIAPRERRRTLRKEWAARAMRHIAVYGSESPMRRALERELHSTHFTPREMEVAGLLCRDYTREQVARELSVSVSYVKNVVTSLFEKTGAKNRLDFLKKWGQ